MGAILRRYKFGIIGSNGFLGSNLCSKLAHKNIKFIKFSSYKKNQKNWISKVLNEIKKHRPDLIVNCAAEQLLNSDETSIKKLINANILTQSVIIKKATQNKNFKGYITFGSKSEFDNLGRVNPLNFYSASKASMDVILNFFSKEFDLPIVSLKLFDTFGVNDKRGKVLNYIKKKYIKNQLIDLTPGNQYLDLVNINDVCNLVFIVSNEIFKKKIKGFKIFTANPQKPIKLKNLIKKLNKILDTKLKVKFGKRNYRKNEQFFNIKKNCNHPKWKIRNKIEKDLKQFFNI